MRKELTLMEISDISFVLIENSQAVAHVATQVDKQITEDLSKVHLAHITKTMEEMADFTSSIKNVIIDLENSLRERVPEKYYNDDALLQNYFDKFEGTISVELDDNDCEIIINNLRDLAEFLVLNTDESPEAIGGLEKTINLLT